MDFVAVDADDKPMCRLSGCSDVIHIEGIGGLGDDWIKIGFPEMVKPHGWSIDCLPKSGLLRLFCNADIKCSEGLSSFQIYAVPRDKP